MKPIPALISPDELTADVRAAFSALREAEAQVDLTSNRLADANENLERKKRSAAAANDEAAKRRLEVGIALRRARKQWPDQGPKAKGWGEFLAREGIHEQSAREWMALAEHVEDQVGKPDMPGLERIPSRREVNEARRERKSAEQAVEDEKDEASRVEIISRGAAIDIRLGRWEQVLLDVGMVDAQIGDPPYGKRTHEAVTTRDDNSNPTGLTPDYDHWTADDVMTFVESWAPRTRGWMVNLTSDDLIPAWRLAYEAADRYAFHPIPCVITGMSVRMQGDGPSSWAVYAMVSRPRNLSKWGTLPGAYVGPRVEGAKSGRGKPPWLMEAIVGDYTRAGDFVVDPFAGYGETLLAAVKLGRRAVGAEIVESARDEAIKRFHARRGAAG